MICELGDIVVVFVIFLLLYDDNTKKSCIQLFCVLNVILLAWWDESWILCITMVDRATDLLFLLLVMVGSFFHSQKAKNSM